MASSITEVANMALGHLGIGVTIADLTTENSAEAKALRTFKDAAIDNVLRDSYWPFATKIQALSLIEEDPNDEWEYSYQYPSDCIEFRKIQSGVRNDTAQSLTKFRIANNGTSNIILTDKDEAIGEWTYRNMVTTRWTPEFTLALSYFWAYLVAPSIAKGDPFGRGQASMNAYAAFINRAKANAMNEEQRDQAPDGELITSRE